ncbi:MAG: ABC transporter ATP-binding protein [Ardenticatenia bacterium]|nr:ABC transporter ATP-binding protein [Ardenticatenia bacterium]
MAMALLEVDNIHAYYGNIHALKGVTISVEKGEIVTLIGGNGAGKSTTLNTISGLLKPRVGDVRLDGESLKPVPAHEVVAMGISQAPEGRRIFGRLTVTENLEMGAFTRSDTSGISQDKERVFTIFPRLKERAKQRAGTLSGGEQQMLSIARALMARPTIFLLDEPSMGLAPILVEEIFSVIRDINREGTTILLVEQNANMALQVASRGYVLETGTVALEGSAKALREDPKVKSVYLGDASTK